jgi:hypothetical protein
MKAYNLEHAQEVTISGGHVVNSIVLGGRGEGSSRTILPIAAGIPDGHHVLLGKTQSGRTRITRGKIEDTIASAHQWLARVSPFDGRDDGDPDVIGAVRAARSAPVQVVAKGTGKAPGDYVDYLLVVDDGTALEVRNVAGVHTYVFFGPVEVKHFETFAALQRFTKMNEYALEPLPWSMLQ